MTRHIRAAQVEAVARPIVAVGNDYPNGHVHPPHQHRRAQLLFAERGTMLVQTAQGAWLVPPSQAIWIPGGLTHAIAMLGAVATRSVYLEPAIGRGAQCEVVGVSALLRQLLIAAVDLPVEYDVASRAGKLMELLLEEVAVAPVLPLNLPFPSDPRLAARCRRFVARPDAQETIDAWSDALGLSRRSFTRRFRRETGLGFAAWQRRACLLAALPRLARGERVTTIAFDLGYSSSAAFATMVRQLTGAPPSRHRGARG